jgi:hypothetical protein
MLRTIFARQILHRQAEVSQDIFHRDSFSASFFKPSFRTGRKPTGDSPQRPQSSRRKAGMFFSVLLTFIFCSGREEFCGTSNDTKVSIGCPLWLRPEAALDY